MPVILVADDDFDSRELMRRRLVRRGYEVVEAADGQSAMGQLAAGPVDLVLLDHLMPDMTGLDVLERIRAAPAIAKVPVIMVTGKTFKEDVADAMSRGAHAYVTKPVDFGAALKLIERALAPSA